jgi:hypothetical protein
MYCIIQYKCYYNYINNANGVIKMNKTISTGNNETLSRGVFPNNDGTWTAMTYSQSKEFKTQAGAAKWFAKRNG